MPKHSKKTVDKVRELNRDPRLTTKDIAKKCKLTVGQVNYILYQLNLKNQITNQIIARARRYIEPEKVTNVKYAKKLKEKAHVRLTKSQLKHAKKIDPTIEPLQKMSLEYAEKLRWIAHPKATVPLQKMSLKTYFDKKDADNLAKIENQEPETVGGRLSRFFKKFLGG